ncbi:M4 family metallopeptidase [Nocardioides sp. AE5]|uniref:M4 family metallopeptidase n=1 Tax=Nocardioides sp. AE5 TaxID=2962573 RepID=UPI002882012F|nr:M4 family metallopeptidase [Nocardioides sp. AE5]MDT0201150.1 M4 family metallopeptidase [Nocardioides sp. AE5]
MRITPAWAGLGLATLATGLLFSTPATADPTDPGSERPTAVDALQANPEAALDSDGQAFTVSQVMTDPDGTTHVRVQRSYRGLEVVGGDMVVHQAADGTLEAVSQSLERVLNLGVKPTVHGTTAERTSLAGLLDSITGLELLEKATLLIDATGATPTLAWRVVTGGMQANGTPSRLATYVDAKTGKVIREEQQIVNVEGEGHTLYSGTVDLHVTQSGSSYTLTDPVHGNAKVTDMGNGTDSILCTLLGIGCSNGSTITSSDPVFGNGSNSDRQTAAADAAYGHAQTYDYFKNVHGRNGIFGNGAAAPSRVHYGNNYANAFWDGEKMTYGDGDGVNVGPLVSLDVSGHEMSHGVTENTANLTYSGESGGLNEATSDIFGTMVEFHANNSVDQGDYYIGEQFDLKNGVGFRRMDKPSTDGNSQDCWTTGTKNLDVHYSSGVGNHFFYLLAEGSGAKTIGGKAHNSPTCDGSTINGIGREKAAAIWFRALTTYFTSSTNYAQARTATLNAAKDLYGAGSTEYNAVAAAWTAVNVNG